MEICLDHGEIAWRLLRLQSVCSSGQRETGVGFVFVLSIRLHGKVGGMRAELQRQGGMQR